MIHRIPGAAMVLALTLSLTPAHAQQTAPAPVPDYTVQLDEFFATIQEGKYAEALGALYGRNPWHQAMTDQLNALKGQFSTLPDLVGELRGSDLIVERRLGGMFVYRWYLVAYDRQPVSFHFTFYKPGDSWFIYSFEYQDDIKDLVQDLARQDLVLGSLEEPRDADSDGRATTAAFRMAFSGTAPPGHPDHHERRRVPPPAGAGTDLRYSVWDPPESLRKD